MATDMGTVPRHNHWPRWTIGLFIVLGASLVYLAKWDPYYHAVFVVAVKHTLGPSIISGTKSTAPAPSWRAAWHYAWTYFKDIWLGFIAGLVIGSGVESLLPPNWLQRVLGQVGWKSRAIAGVAAMPSMMCTCCSAPIAVNLKRQNVSTGAVLAYWVGNPILNPATIVFMGFVLGWNWAVMRIVLGIVLIMTVSKLGDVWQPAGMDNQAWNLSKVVATPDAGGIITRFFATLWRLITRLVPEYIVLVLALGAARAWLFPAVSANISHAWWLWIVYAVGGTLFVIPTAGEVPIVSTLMHYGLGIGPAAVLMMTLPAISLPSMAMVSTALPKSLLAKLALTIALFGLFTGAIAHFVL